MRHKAVVDLGGGGIRSEGGGRGERCKLTHCVRLCPICLCICGVSALNIS